MQDGDAYKGDRGSFDAPLVADILPVPFHPLLNQQHCGHVIPLFAFTVPSEIISECGLGDVMLDKSLKTTYRMLSRWFFLNRDLEDAHLSCAKPHPNAAFFLLITSEELPESDRSQPVPPYRGSKISTVLAASMGRG